MSDNAATDPSMQAIASRVEAALAPELDAELGDEPGAKAKSADEVIEDVNLPDDADDDLPDDDDSEDEEENQEDDLESIADEDDVTLASYLGLDEEQLNIDDETGEVTFLAKIDGEVQPVPIKDLVTSYQLQGHVNNESVALSNERKEFEQVRETVTSELKTRIEGVLGLSKVLENELVTDYNSIDWDALRTRDPAQWTAMRQEYAEKAHRIQQAQELIGQQMQQTNQEGQKEAMEQFKKHIAFNRNKVVEAHPEWADESKFRAGIDEINTFLKSNYQFTDDELKALNDHRLLQVIEDAKAYRTGKQGAEKKRVKKVPKFAKPGASRAQAASLAKARKAKAVKKGIKDSGGSVGSVANAILDRM